MTQWGVPNLGGRGPAPTLAPFGRNARFLFVRRLLAVR